jgi:hypothetical protein
VGAGEETTNPRQHELPFQSIPFSLPPVPFPRDSCSGDGAHATTQSAWSEMAAWIVRWASRRCGSEHRENNFESLKSRIDDNHNGLAQQQQCSVRGAAVVVVVASLSHRGCPPCQRRFRCESLQRRRRTPQGCRPHFGIFASAGVCGAPVAAACLPRLLSEAARVSGSSVQCS